MGSTSSPNRLDVFDTKLDDQVCTYGAPEEKQPTLTEIEHCDLFREH